VTPREKQQQRGSRWTDDRGASDTIEGFELDTGDEASASLRAFFPPPEIPKHWQPKFLRMKASRFEAAKTQLKNPTPSERRLIVS
jgi:hypothetical protein